MRSRELLQNSNNITRRAICEVDCYMITGNHDEGAQGVIDLVRLTPNKKLKTRWRRMGDRQLVLDGLLLDFNLFV